MNKVLEKVEVKMNQLLDSVDYKKLPSGVRIRWHESAEWEKYKMAKDGLLRSDSPKGVWQITEKGRIFFDQQRRLRATNSV